MNKNIQLKNKETYLLFKRLPMKYWDKVDYLERDYGLCDDCKFMLYLNDGYKFFDGGDTMPVKNITEAIKFIKEV